MASELRKVFVADRLFVSYRALRPVILLICHQSKSQGLILSAGRRSKLVGAICRSPGFLSVRPLQFLVIGTVVSRPHSQLLVAFAKARRIVRGGMLDFFACGGLVIHLLWWKTIQYSSHVLRTF